MQTKIVIWAEVESVKDAKDLVDDLKEVLSDSGIINNVELEDVEED